MKTFLIATIVLCCFSGLSAQERTDTTRIGEEMSQTTPDSALGGQTGLLQDTVPQSDGYYQVNDLHDAVPFAYPKVNQKNIRFYKRVWRDIDLKDEQNAIFAIPGASLMEGIMKGIKEGKLTPYNPEDDGFKTRLSAREGEARFTDSVLVPIFDNEGNQIDAKMTLNEFNPEKVTKFRIKEDIFFDKQRGKLETRIIGVAPLMTINSSAELADAVGETPAFWLYFPQLRYTLVQMDVSDPDRELYDMTMDDLFVQRKFSSRIVRQSSPNQQMQYATGEQSDDISPDEIEDKIKLYKARLWRNPKGVNADELVTKDDDYIRAGGKGETSVKKRKAESKKEEGTEQEQ
ncbi:gliding motility protein GldN [Olivibacter sp. XZL3]|uniref:type IX secretion system ring protein PorN/GldN n=1 Tax=Olivibacter sp. XZL3 TaxID=1735116 RepID=UPI001064BD6E|nr:gliding motility protein GldN [Olivibacter sp. XZL3]